LGKRRVGRYPRAFRQMAVDRLRKCDNVVVLSEELGVHRRLLYKWRKQLEPAEPGGPAPPDLREFTLGKEISQLKRLLAEKIQEVDFFKGALQKVEARRRSNESTGARASTTKSGK
jgi:transposase-like protein